jgi:hypothetical protein
MTNKFLKPIKSQDMKTWHNERQSLAINIAEDFFDSDMQMAEIDLTEYPLPKPKRGSAKTSKEDSFASSFYAWKKKQSTQERLAEKGVDILLVRRADKIALKKKVRNA